MNLRRKLLTSVLIKPSGPDCNLACEYCFYVGKSSMFGAEREHRMSDEVLEQSVRQILEQSPECVAISWQGGEPTLLGVEFFEKAVQYERKYGDGKTVGNSFQTNGILIDKRWAEFFRENEFLVGLSIDGPEHIHNYYRTHMNGDPSWHQAMRAASLLRESLVAVNAVSTVNDYSANYPEEMYSFLKGIGISHMQFIPVMEPAKDDKQNVADFSVSPVQYGEFLLRLFSRWSADYSSAGPSTFIRFFDSVFYHYVGLDPPECEMNPVCGTYLVVEHTGEVYSCDFFVEPAWKLGSVHEDELVALLNSPKQNQFGNMKVQLHEDCVECNWLKYCHAGCTKDRVGYPVGHGKSYFCESYKMFFEVADARFQELAHIWKGYHPHQ